MQHIIIIIIIIIIVVVIIIAIVTHYRYDMFFRLFQHDCTLLNDVKLEQFIYLVWIIRFEFVIPYSYTSFDNTRYWILFV